MIQDVTVTLPTLVTVVVISATWAGSIAGVYFGLKNKVSALSERVTRLKEDLDRGSVRFATIDARVNSIEERQSTHAERIIVVETLLDTMNKKLDDILVEVRQ